MASKFTEVFNVPAEESFSKRNVSLDDILEETRRRASSTSVASSSSGSSSPTDTQASGTATPSTAMKKLRRLTAGGSKSKD